MKHEAGIPSRASHVPVREDFVRAKAMHASREGIEHSVVAQWLLTWGTPDFKDFPDWLRAQDG